MPPESDGGGTRIVKCSFEKIIVDEQVKQDLREVIRRVHEAAIYASELLNIHIRLQIEQNGFCTHDAFDKNELAKVFQSVTAKPKSSTSAEWPTPYCRKLAMPKPCGTMPQRHAP